MLSADVLPLPIDLLPTSLNPVIGVVGLGLALLVGLGLRMRRLVGTTLLGPWCWTAIATLEICGTELMLALIQTDETTTEAWRFVAATSAFCPLMSLLGAKRPQDHAWHFVVLTLWGMLALPAAEALVLRPGQPLAIIDFRAWFLLALIGLGLLVLLPTRRWLGALLTACGQTILFWSYLPGVEAAATGWHVAGALVCFLLALLLTFSQRPKGNQSFDTLWCDFRDWFGALWAARVLERVNAAAVMYDWPIRLGWSGFHAADNPGASAEISPELAMELKQNMVNLLRRFVSQAWIDERMP